MKRVLKFAVISAAAVAATFSALPAAQARDGWRHHHHGGGDDFVAAGILGLAVGALAAGIATAPEPDYYEPMYREPRPRPRPVRQYYVEPEVVYLEGPVYALEPWSSEWYRYCRDTYRSFNPRTGTFVGYDGNRHFCQAN